MAGKNTQVELIPTKGSSAIEHVESHLPASPISQVMELAQNKDFDPAKFETMVDYMRVERERSDLQDFNSAMSAFQSECPNVKRTTQGHGYKYPTYEDLLDVVQPFLKKYGISIRFSFPPSGNTDTMRVVGYVSIGAYEKKSEFELPMHRLPKKMVPDENDARNVGATISYAKRYCIVNALNIVTEGEDKEHYLGGESITKDEANAIEALIGDIEQELGGNFNMTGWRKYLKIDENTPIEDIPKPAYSKAVNSLKGKLNELRKGKK
jgi:hypothetical protein